MSFAYIKLKDAVKLKCFVPKKLFLYLFKAKKQKFKFA